MIKMQVIGHLGRDCMTNMVNGKSVMNFTIAHTERFRDAQGNQKDRTTWVDCAYWSERTGIAPYLKKGTQVYVEGTPEVRTYTKNDGTPGFSLTLRVQQVQLLGGRNDAANNSGGSYAPSQNNNTSYAEQPAGPAISNESPESVDDLPF